MINIKIKNILKKYIFVKYKERYMKCGNCNNKINFSEQNYFIEGNIFCNNCIKEEQIIIFKLNDYIYNEDEVSILENKEDYKYELENLLDRLNTIKSKYKNLKNIQNEINIINIKLKDLEV